MRLLSLTVLLWIAGNGPALADNAPSAGSGDSPLFGTIPIVEAAALHSQTLREAPADVTIVTDADIRRYGYRTLNDVLASVRGFFSSSDRIYNYIGVRGFSLPGDYNTRFLVMLNGHPLTDQVYDSNGLFGQDLGIDMELVARIEIIRGPSSALYGSNGMLANINIITKAPVDFDRVRVSTEADSLGEKKVTASSAVYLGRGLNLLISASLFNNAGSPLRFPGIGGPISGVDGEKGYHSFANAIWHNWTFTAYFNSRAKQPPVPWGADTILFARGDMVRDARNFLEAGWSRDVGTGKLAWKVHYDQYRYNDRFYYPASEAGEEVDDFRSLARGDSIGTQLTWQKEVARIGEFTAGAQLDVQLRNLQQEYTVNAASHYFPPIRHPDLRDAVFVQQQWKMTNTIAVYGGLRLDNSRSFGVSLSPRAAVVYQVSQWTTGKLVYGRPFRNPSAFEQYYTDDGMAFLANPALRPESAQTVEGSIEQKLSSHVSLIADIYDYHLSRLIAANFLESGAQQFANTGASHSRGVEFELNATAGSRLETNVSYSLGESVLDGMAMQAVPTHIGKFRAATPFRQQRFWLAFSLEYMSSRLDVKDSRVRPVVLGDVTLTSTRLLSGCDMSAGIRNVAGWRYTDPVALALPQMPADGRSFFVTITYGMKQ